jgi:hypothetical protein
MKKITETPEVESYGRENFAQGYKTGFEKNASDRRKRLSLKEMSQRKRFGEFYDWLDDKIAANKKK